MLAHGTTVTSPRGLSTLDCGSALGPNTEKLAHDAHVDQLSNAMLGLPGDAEPMAGVRSCEDVLTTRHMFGWPLGGLRHRIKPRRMPGIEPNEAGRGQVDRDGS